MSRGNLLNSSDLNSDFHNEQGFAPEAALAGLPPLTGAAGDIEAAGPVRLTLLEKADDILGQLRSDATETASQADTAVVPPQQVSYVQVKAAEVALHRLRHQADARWWLDNGSKTASELLAQFAME